MIDHFIPPPDWVKPGVRVVHPAHGAGVVLAVYWSTARVWFERMTRFGTHTLEPAMSELEAE